MVVGPIGWRGGQLFGELVSVPLRCSGLRDLDAGPERTQVEIVDKHVELEFTDRMLLGPVEIGALEFED